MTDVAAADPSAPALARLTVLAGPTAVGKGTVDPHIVDHYVVFGALGGAISCKLITSKKGIPS